MRLLFHQIAARHHELDVDVVAALPMRKIMDWATFFAMENEDQDEDATPETGGRSRGTKVAVTDPAIMEKLLAARYGG